jgi:predicted enzyme related to lactoylglutathione lyase
MAKNPFVHIELTTEDTERATSFYKKVFKWKLKPMKGMPYTMIDTGAKDVGGGIQPKPMAEAPTAWLAYVRVDDVKKTVAAAEAAGARVVVPYQPIPGMGALGIFIDPTGAALGVWEPGKKTAAPRRPAKAAAKKKRSSSRR